MKKVLNVIVCVSLCLSSFFSFNFVNVNANGIMASENSEESTSFYDFLAKIEKININYLDEESKNSYNESFKKISEIYKQKNKFYSENELHIRTKIYWAFIKGMYYGDKNMIEGLKYLELTPIEITSILTTTNPKLIGADAELFKLSLGVLIIDQSRLNAKEKVIYDKIERYIRNKSKDLTEDKIREAVNLIWAINQIDLSNCSLEDKINVLNAISLNLDSFQDIKFLTLKGSNEEIISDVYKMVFLREADEEGKKYWASVLEELKNDGKNFDESIKEIINRMKQDTEYKNLVSKFKD